MLVYISLLKMFLWLNSTFPPQVSAPTAIIVSGMFIIGYDVIAFYEITIYILNLYAAAISYWCAPIASVYIITKNVFMTQFNFSHQVSTPTDVIRFLKKSYTGIPVKFPADNIIKLNIYWIFTAFAVRVYIIV